MREPALTDDLDFVILVGRRRDSEFLASNPIVQKFGRREKPSIGELVNLLFFFETCAWLHHSLYTHMHTCAPIHNKAMLFFIMYVRVSMHLKLAHIIIKRRTADMFYSFIGT